MSMVKVYYHMYTCIWISVFAYFREYAFVDSKDIELKKCITG